jgi:hypothetical protein
MSSRFAVIADTHFFAPHLAPEDKLYWNRVLQSRSPEIARNLVDTINCIGPDFVIHCGDFTGLCDMGNYEFGCRIMDQLTCPWYAVLGNHDTWYPGVRAAFSARMDLPPGCCHYARDLAGMRVLFLDVAYWTSAGGETSPYLDKDLYDSGQIAGMGPTLAELDWLDSELRECRDRPAILVSHAPLGFKDAYAVGTLPRGRPAQTTPTSLADYMGDMLLRHELRQTVRRHRHVKAAFAGHWHIHDVAVDDGVVYCQTASLREYPFDLRLVRRLGDSLHVSTIPLRDSTFPGDSYVAEWGNDWVAGLPGDRDFVIPLT